MIYSILVASPFPDNPDDAYGERSFEVQAGSPTEALRIAEQRISKSQEQIIKVEYAGED